MKQILAALAIAASLASAGMIYPETMEVTAIHGERVTMQTVNGHVYEMEDVIYQVGDIVSLVMFNNGTELCYDDIILSARYSGYTKNIFTNN